MEGRVKDFLFVLSMAFITVEFLYLASEGKLVFKKIVSFLFLKRQNRK